MIRIIYTFLGNTDIREAVFVGRTDKITLDGSTITVKQLRNFGAEETDIRFGSDVYAEMAWGYFEYADTIDTNTYSFVDFQVDSLQGKDD